MSIVSESEESTLGNIDVELVGAIDDKEEGNEKLSTTFKVGIGDEGMEMNFEGEYRTIGSDSYVKVDTYPSLFSMYIGDIEGKWINLETSDIESTTSLFSEEAVSEEKKEVTEEDIDKLMEFVTDDTITKNAEFLPDEDIEGIKCSCIRVSWSQEELKELIKRYNEIYEQEYTDEELDEAVENVESLQVDACVGKQDNMIHRIGMKMVGKSDSSSSDIELDLKLWDYSADMGIEAPTDAVTLDEAMGTSEVLTTARDTEVQAVMMGIQFEIEMYYTENMEYPESLDALELEETTFYGEEVSYTKSSDGYILSITLPSGEEYEITN
jgi:hypothetical protein